MKIDHSFHKTIIRSYDIRGIFNKTLFQKDAWVIGHLFGSKIGKGNIINVGYDGRLSSVVLKDSLIQGILESGANVCEVGLVPTPLLYFSCIKNNSKGGIMVTGSHNPKDYNGFKFVLNNLPFYGDDLTNLARSNVSSSKEVGEMTKFNFCEPYIINLFKNFSQKKKY